MQAAVLTIEPVVGRNLGEMGSAARTDVHVTYDFERLLNHYQFNFFEWFFGQLKHEQMLLVEVEKALWKNEADPSHESSHRRTGNSLAKSPSSTST